MSIKKIKEKIKAFLLRLPSGVYDAMKEKAVKENRSMNSEIIVAIKKHLGVKNG